MFIFVWYFREEYIKLQNRLSDVERENSILLSSSLTQASDTNSSSLQGNREFVERILKAVAGLAYQEKYSDVHIRLAGETPDQATQEVFAHKFVLSTRNESWGRNELKYLGKEF